MENNQILQGAAAGQDWVTSVKSPLSPVALSSRAPHRQKQTNKKTSESRREHRSKTKVIFMELCRATPSPPPAGLTPGVTFQSGAGSPCLTMFFPTGPRCHKSSELRWDSCWALSSRACGEGEDAQGREKEIVRAIGLTSNQWPRAPKSCDVVNLGSSRPWDPQFRGWGGPAAWAGCQCYQIWVGATSWPEVFGSFRARNCPLAWEARNWVQEQRV